MTRMFPHTLARTFALIAALLITSLTFAEATRVPAAQTAFTVGAIA